MIQKLTEAISIVFTESGFSSSNCVHVKDGASTLMIDSGAGAAMTPVEPWTVDMLLCSHHHLDHIGGNDMFTKAVIRAHPFEREAMQSCGKLLASDSWSELMDVENFMMSKTLFGKPNRLYEPFRVDGDLADGQVVECGRTKINVMHTPGHTAGHCSFYFPADGIVFTGDICLTAVGPWYGDSDSSIESFIASINRIIDLKPRLLVTGHCTRVVEENIGAVLAEYRDRIMRREEKILGYVKRNPSTIHELAKMHFIYPEHPSDFVLYWEKSIVRTHLNRLMAMGEMCLGDNGRYFAAVTPQKAAS
ncbi:MAG TPA: MBL fold metallo-hydrolase [Spirochaetota bacterium]|mgnify:CR=1 FL=1|nr:MBL fold metallo-hydrolase [Spirochaetota bacterium]HOD14479.1 MBL fold metallo-hydrolase [Spirochaetota bacterium]HPG51481.1 MBL fold metallo-hydrolase [Spirochaetota bacterium]HPN11831.1 MBL fold metallo-hydrolase [Spirochaetota bacterium]